MISFQLPNPVDLGIPDWIIKLAQVKKGLVLVTGPAGSGKSTTQACMIDAINNNYAKHIITLEDPIEHLHSHKKHYTFHLLNSCDIYKVQLRYSYTETLQSYHKNKVHSYEKRLSFYIFAEK